MAISDYDTNPANNTVLSGIPVTDNTAVNAVDDLVRQLMADTRTEYDVSRTPAALTNAGLDTEDLTVNGNWTVNGQWSVTADWTFTGRPDFQNKATISGTFPELVINDANDNGTTVVFQRNGGDRWRYGGSTDAETGGNAGTDFRLRRYDDAGALIGNAFTIKRDNGHMLLNGETFLTEETPALVSPGFNYVTDANQNIRCYGQHEPGQWVGHIINVDSVFFQHRNNGIGLAPGGWQTGSDESLKDNITAIPDALAKLATVRGATFTRNDLGNMAAAGVIAQDIQAVLPEGVMETAGLLSVDPLSVIALLVEGLKEAKARIEALENP